MSYIAAAIGGSAFLGYLASGQSADAMGAASDRSAALQKEMFDQQRLDQAPWRQAGTNALARQQQLLGLGAMTRNQMREQLLPRYTTGATQATQGQPIYDSYGEGGEARVSGYAPDTLGTTGTIDEAGLNRAIEEQWAAQDTGGDFGKYARDFGMQDYQADPGYRFRLSEGMKALGNQASARGGLISGQTMKGMQNYAQESASQEFQNAFNRYQTNRSAQLNPLQSLSGGGQTATNQMGQAGQNFANQMGQAYMGAGQAQASGYLGQAGAVTGGVGSWMNYNQNQNMMNRIWPQSAVSQGGSWGSPQMGGDPHAQFNLSQGWT